MRVANGTGQAEHATFSPEVELALTRGVEMFAESIPGCVMQLAALLREGGGYSKRALASIILSAFTTGFSAAMVSFGTPNIPTYTIPIYNH